MRLVFVSWLLVSVGVFTAARLGQTGNLVALRPVVAVTGLLACCVIWRLYRLGWDVASLPPVPERTRRQARWLLWTLIAVGISGGAREIARAYQRALGG